MLIETEKKKFFFEPNHTPSEKEMDLNAGSSPACSGVRT